MTASKEPSNRLVEAVDTLVAEARRQLEAHPWGHLLNGRQEPLEVRLSLPLAGRREDLGKAARLAEEAVTLSLQSLIQHRAIFRPGQIFCLRCSSTDCEHSAPTEPRCVFTGYGPTGIPRFVDYGQWLLECQDPRVSSLYQASPRLLTCQSKGEDLSSQLLPAYRDRRTGFRLHGQVTAGWYSLKDAEGTPHNLAFSFHLLSTQGRRGPRRFGLNVVGIGPQGENLEDLFDRLGRPPWAEALRWAREALETLEASSRSRGKGRRGAARGKNLEERLEGILGGLNRRLEKGYRARNRRTQHAQERHDSGSRPTDMAVADLKQAAPEQVLFDTQKETLVILGDRGRTHFFNRAGKHVTSVRYNLPSIERRQQKGTWRPATVEERARLANLAP